MCFIELHGIISIHGKGGDAMQVITGFKESNGKLTARIFLHKTSAAIAAQNALRAGYNPFYRNESLSYISLHYSAWIL